MPQNLKVLQISLKGNYASNVEKGGDSFFSLKDRFISFAAPFARRPRVEADNPF